MRNSELLAWPYPATLTIREKQTRTALRCMTTPMPCPNCRVEQSYLQALGIPLDEYDANAEKQPASTAYCISCAWMIRYVVPFFSDQIRWEVVPANRPWECQ